MKKYVGIIYVLALIKLFIQVLGNRNYGFHRVELLHLSVSEHLDWGYMVFPPMIGFIGRVSYLITDYSLQIVRIFPPLAMGGSINCMLPDSYRIGWQKVCCDICWNFYFGISPFLPQPSRV